MGILVFGAEKVEEGVEQLKRGFLTMTYRAMITTDPHIRSTWKSAKRSLGATGVHLSPLERRIKSSRAQLGHWTETLVPKIEISTRKALAVTIDGTIALLEKARRRLDGSPVR